LSLSTNKKANPIVKDLPIFRAMTNFLAIIQHHLASYPIEQSYELVKNDLQQLIITFIENPLPIKLQEQAIEQYLLSPKQKIDFDDLLSLVSEIDSAYIAIIGKENINKIIHLDMIKTFFALNPHAHTKNILEHNDAALATNFGFFVLTMYNLDQITLSKKKKTEILYFLKEAIIRYGAYALVLDFWQVDKDDNSQMIRNIEILASRIKLQTNHSLSFNLEQIKEKLAA